MSYVEFRLDFQADRTTFLDFWREHFPGWPTAKYDWFYLNNPTGPTIGCGVKTSDDDALLGSTAAFPRELLVAGQLRMGGINGDLGVQPSHRILGPAIMLQKGIMAATRQEGVDVLYGLPNKSSEPVLKRVGYHVIGRTVRMVKVLKSRSRLARRINLPLFTWLASLVLDLALRLTSPETYRARPKDLRARLLERFDDRFDRLWDRAKGSFEVIGKRDRTFLSWRFEQCPYRDFQVMGLERTDNQELTGYVVFHDTDDGAAIADILAEDAVGLEMLLTEFVRFCRSRSAKAVVMAALENERMVTPFRRMRFHVQPREFRVTVGIDRADPQAEILLDSANWWLTDGDNDV